jgi:hypothetical protein
MIEHLMLKNSVSACLVRHNILAFFSSVTLKNFKYQSLSMLYIFSVLTKVANTLQVGNIAEAKFISSFGEICRISPFTFFWLMYFVYVYGNRTMKPVEIVLRGKEKGDEGI